MNGRAQSFGEKDEIQTTTHPTRIIVFHPTYSQFLLSVAATLKKA